MGKLHDQLKTIGYTGHSLEVMLIRLLFCLFAEDTGIFAKYQFTHFIQRKTKNDGSDLAAQLSHLFHILNEHENQRLKNLDADLAEFAYINGQLFAENLPPASFDDEMRALLLNACEMDWSKISPEIFGALFQSVMDKDERRSLGAHYTSEENILKVISSLFLNDLRTEFDEIRKKGRSKARITALDTFHEKLSNLDFLDPACGCGNFLIVAYRELRMLELDVIEAIHKKNQLLDVSTIVRCNVSQFHGIEIEDFPSQIARVAMWLVDHQMNMLVSQHYGTHFARIPLKTSADIQNANALVIMWPAVDYIFGNPPFIGAKLITKEQRQSFDSIMSALPKSGVLDFVTAWYVKAVHLMKANTVVKTAFVSTNSITQGEQVPILWSHLLSEKIFINFAHRTFQWQNSAKGKAAVHCVIIGFSLGNNGNKVIFDYPDIKGEPVLIDAKNINPYLVNADNILIESRKNPLCSSRSIIRGSIPYDDGHLTLTLDEFNQFSANYPNDVNLIRKYGAAKEMLSNQWRYCIWLHNISPHLYSKNKFIMQRIQENKQFRESPEVGQSVKSKATTPALFGDIRQPDTNYLMFPRVSSERRNYLPIAYFDPSVILGDSAYGLPNATLYDFGIMTSIMHNSWMRTVCGRLKSDYRYSASIVYNNFPFPQNISEKQKQSIEIAAQAVLNARAKYPESSLADLYGSLSMPPNLLKAHKTLDKIVDATYTKQQFSNEAERIAFLFKLYEQYTQDEKVEPNQLKAKK